MQGRLEHFLNQRAVELTHLCYSILQEALAHFGQVDACVMVAGVLAAAKSWIETDVADFDFTNTYALVSSTGVSETGLRFR